MAALVQSYVRILCQIFVQQWIVHLFIHRGWNYECMYCGWVPTFWPYNVQVLWFFFNLLLPSPVVFLLVHVFFWTTHEQRLGSVWFIKKIGLSITLTSSPAFCQKILSHRLATFSCFRRQLPIHPIYIYIYILCLQIN